MLKELMQFLSARLTASEPKKITDERHNAPQVVVIPDNHKLEQLPGFIPPPPAFVNTKLRFDTPDSLAAYLADFGTQEARLFANLAGREVLAVLDYHKPEGADRLQHRARWVMKVNDLFSPWMAQHEKPMTHRQLIAFLDRHGDSIVSPASDEIIGMVEQMEVVTSGSKVSLVARHGERAAIKVQSDEQVQGKTADGVVIQPIREFELMVPVRLGALAQKVRVDVHWTTDNGLGAVLCVHDMEKLLREAFEAGVEAIASATGRMVLMGCIEG